MHRLKDIAIPNIGTELDVTPIYHFFRDLFITFILWQIGFRDFYAAFTTMLVSGFFEAGNGICYYKDGSNCFFDFIDFLPSVFAGFLVVSFLSKDFDLMLLAKLFIIYVLIVLFLILLNKLLGRDIIIKK